SHRAARGSRPRRYRFARARSRGRTSERSPDRELLLRSVDQLVSELAAGRGTDPDRRCPRRRQPSRVVPVAERRDGGGIITIGFCNVFPLQNLGHKVLSAGVGVDVRRQLVAHIPVILRLSRREARRSAGGPALCPPPPVGLCLALF